jgi:hypothetical protein
MRYYKIIENGYFLGVGSGIGGTEITKEEHDRLLEVIMNHPEAKENCGYCLREDLTWELCEFPVIEDEATAEDYQQSLESLGVDFNA